MQSKPSFSLRELLDHCIDNESRYYNLAWEEFLKRFLPIIRRAVTIRSQKWKHPRLDRQRPEIREEIISDVTKKLLLKLKNYHGDNEIELSTWLTTVAFRETSYFLKKNFIKHELPEHQDVTLEQLSPDRDSATESYSTESKYELFEEVMSTLRSSRKNQTKEFERDLHLYYLTTFEDLSEEMLRSSHPYFADLGDSVLRNIRHRFTRILKSKFNSENDSDK